jgi:hypothetical protein
VEVATFYAGWSLLPFSLGVGLSAYAVFTLLFGPSAGLVFGLAFTGVALLLLYGWGFLLRSRTEEEPPVEKEKPTELKTKIEQLLTEARVIIPGGQALLGFQFIATLTKAFSELPLSIQISHTAALCAVALAVALLMTPAAIHRIAFDGADSARFYRIASPVVIGATFPLALGIAIDTGIVFWKVAHSLQLAMTASAAAFTVLMLLWLVLPFAQRTRA